MKKFFNDTINQSKQFGQFNLGNFYFSSEKIFQQFGFREEQQSGVKNILVMRLDAIGDFVLTTGFICELRFNYPCARITLVVSKIIYPIAELCPYVNRVLEFDSKFSNGADMLTVIDRIYKFAYENLWQEHFDLEFTMQWGSENHLPIFMGYLSGARERIGYGYQIELMHFDKLPPKEQDANYLFLTKPIINPRRLIHEVEKHFYVLKAIGLSVRSEDMELWYNQAEIQRAKELLGSISPHSIRIVVGIGAGGDSRKYSVEKYIEAFKKIIKDVNKKTCFIIVGGKAEIADAEKIQKSLPVENVLNLVEKTTLRETMAIIEQSDLFIGNDTGVMHMAAVLKVPIIAIYRQPEDRDHIVPGVFNEYYRFAPYTRFNVKTLIIRPDHALGDCENAIVYGGCKEPFAHCINQIKPDEIVEAFLSMTCTV